MKVKLLISLIVLLTLSCLVESKLKNCDCEKQDVADQSGSFEKNCECWCDFQESIESTNLSQDQSFTISIGKESTTLIFDTEKLIFLQLKVSEREIQICDFHSNCVSHQISLKDENQLKIELDPLSNKYSIAISNSTFSGISTKSRISHLKHCSFSTSNHFMEKRQTPTPCSPSFVRMSLDSPDSFVYAISTFRDDIYIGGAFLKIGSLRFNYIARWNGSSWLPVGSSSENGTAFTVYALAEFQNSLYVGGQFSSVAGVSISRQIARFDGTNWFALNSGNDLSGNYVLVLKVIGSLLYVGGFFNSTAFGLYNVGAWDGTNWIALGNGTNSIVRAIESIGSDIFFGGQFTRAGSVAANYTARWSGSNWFALGLGTSALVSGFVTIGNDLYAGGGFSSAGGVVVNYVARWNGTRWFGLGAGVDTQINSILAVGTSDIYVGGLFTVAGGVTSNHIAKWTGTTWATGSSAFGSGVDNLVFSISLVNQSVYLGGSFTLVNGSNIPYIVKYNACPTAAPTPAPLPTPAPTPAPCSPSFLGLGTLYHPSTVATAYAYGLFQNSLYIGGTFTMIGGFSLNYIARWNGTNYSDLNFGTNDTVYAIASFQNNLYVGGSFGIAGNGVNAVFVNSIARWNGTRWFPVGSGFSGRFVLAFQVIGSILYIGGNFSFSSSGSPMLNVVGWDGSNFSALGDGVNDYVYAMTSIGTTLYVGGRFTSAGMVSVGRVAKWDGSSWSSIGPALNNIVLAMASIGNDIFVGGQFTSGLGASYIMRSNGTNWFSLNNQGTNIDVNSLLAIGNELYIAGDFTTAGGSPAGRIAKWNGTWSSSEQFGTGLNAEVRALLYWPPNLYVGGAFSMANGTNIGGLARIGLCNIPAPTPSSPTPATVAPTHLPTTTTSQTTATPSTSTTENTGNNAAASSSAGTSTTIIIGVVVGIVLLILICILIILVVIIVRRRKSQRNGNGDGSISLNENKNDTHYASVDGKPQYVPISDVTNALSSNNKSSNQYSSTSAITNSNDYQGSAQYVSCQALQNNNGQYVSSTTVLENTATKKEAKELFKKFAIPYSDLKLDKELGKGNFGSVYLAYKKSDPTKQPIACKQISNTIASNTNASTASDALKKETKSFRDFIAEAKVLESIPPSNYVVRFIGMCSEPFCILTEFIDGGSLSDFLASPNNQIDFNTAVGFLKQICKGIAHLHKNGIIHRDLAARNVLLRTKIDEETQVRQCVLVDMGLARLFETGENYLKTKSPIPLKWTAPEALRDKKFSEKSDMYSFGILAIECFTRSPPFPQMSGLECAMAVSSGKLTPSVKDICPVDLVPIFDPCFSLNPDQRPSASLLLKQLN